MGYKIAIVWRGDSEMRAAATPENNRYRLRPAFVCGRRPPIGLRRQRWGRSQSAGDCNVAFPPTSTVPEERPGHSVRVVRVENKREPVEAMTRVSH